MVKKVCVSITDEQDQKIRTIQVRRMSVEKKTIAYSKVIQQCIDEGLKVIPA